MRLSVEADRNRILDRFRLRNLGSERFAFLASITCCLLVSIVGCKEQHSQNELAARTSKVQLRKPSLTTKDSASGSIEEPSGEGAAASTTAIRFENVVSESGINDIIISGMERNLFGIVESVGAGISLIDYDLDGLQDIALPGGLDRPGDGNVVGFSGGLHRSVSPFRFVSVGAAACFDLSSTASQDAATGDIDSDGFDDIFVSGYGGIQCFINQGDGTFAKLSSESGLTDDLWSSASLIADLNGDTLPDLYVARYADWSLKKNPLCFSRDPVSDSNTKDVEGNGTPVTCGPLSFEAYDDLIFFSNGDGTFVDVSTKAGVAKGGRGLAVIAADLDDDRDLDVYVANDCDQNFLYRNNADGTLTEIAVRSGVATCKEGVSQGSMGISVGDINGDKRPDLFVTNFMKQLPAIYVSRGRLNFRFNTAERGIDLLGRKHVSWGTSMMDFDNDGDEDIVVVSGNVDKDETRKDYNQTPSLLENFGKGILRDNSKIAGGFFATEMPARGLATADFDSDGKMDFVTSNLDLPIGILKNTSETEGHWLEIKVIGVKSARNAIGTALELQAGERGWVRQVFAGGSFSSSSDRTVHFGVAKDTLLPAKLILRWPSGTTDELQIDQWDQKLTIVESGQ